MTPLPVAIVTGGNRGIGYEICRQLARHNIHVILTSRDTEKGKAACDALVADGLSVSFHQLDVTNSAHIESIAEFVASRHERVDVLINNAGIAIDPPGARFLDSSVETYRLTFETNVLAPLALTQALLPLMQKRNYGRIVNVSSGLGQLSEMGSGTPAYRLSKTALNALTRIVAAGSCEARAARSFARQRRRHRQLGRNRFCGIPAALKT